MAGAALGAGVAHGDVAVAFVWLEGTCSHTLGYMKIIILSFALSFFCHLLLSFFFVLSFVPVIFLSFFCHFFVVFCFGPVPCPCHFFVIFL